MPLSELFSETQSRFLLSVSPEQQEAFEAIVKDAKRIGTVTDDAKLTIKSGNEQALVEADRTRITICLERSNSMLAEIKGLNEECGVVGVWGHPDAAQIAYYGLHSLQHRGQEGAGIVVSDGDSAFNYKR